MTRDTYCFSALNCKNIVRCGLADLCGSKDPSINGSMGAETRSMLQQLVHLLMARRLISLMWLDEMQSDNYDDDF